MVKCLIVCNLISCKTYLHTISFVIKKEDASVPSQLKICSSLSSENNKLTTKDGKPKAKTDPKHITLHPLTSSMSFSTSPSGCELSHLDDPTKEKGNLTCIIQMIRKNINILTIIYRAVMLSLNISYF